MREKTGRVIKSTGSWMDVLTDSGEIYECKIKGKFRIKGIRSTNPVAVGDVVDFRVDRNHTGLITGIRERRNYIIRKSTKLSKASHMIAANIDQAFIVATVNYPATTLNFIDRFLVTAEAYSIPPVLVFNKIDMYDKSEMERVNEWYGTYHEIGYKCLGTSIKTGQGMDELKELMQGKTSVFAGHSGVGKSSLINYIDSHLNLKTDSISSIHKTGKHTTTFSEMFPLEMGGYIVDTPGIRSFGMIDMKNDDVSHFFPEIFEKSSECRFNNCSHTHEPGCAVINAVEQGNISLSRYENYISILNEDEDEKYRAGY